jgi:hypothetical protein
MGWLNTYFLALIATERVEGPEAARRLANTANTIILIFVAGIFALFAAGFINNLIHDSRLHSAMESKPFQDILRQEEDIRQQDRDIEKRLNDLDSQPPCWLITSTRNCKEENQLKDRRTLLKYHLEQLEHQRRELLDRIDWR